MRSRALRAIVLGALLFAAGCARGRTEMVVVIGTDGVRVPDEVDALRIQVIDEASTGDDSRFDMTQPLCRPQLTENCIDFPVTMTLIPGSMRPSDSVRVRVDALRATTPVISDAAVFTFAEGRSLELDVTLWAACLGNTDCAAQDQACGPDNGCVPLTPEPLPGQLDFSHVSDLGAPEDLGGADLAGADLAAVDLAGADLSPLPPPPPATFVQKSTYCQGTGSCTASFGAPSTAGNLLVASCGLASDLVPVLPAGWTQAVIDQPGTGANVSIWFYLDTAGGTSSVPVGGGGGGTVWAEISEWSGPTALDATGIKTAVQAASITAMTSTPANGSVGISMFGEATAAQPVMFTPGTWQNLANNGGAANGWHLTTEYLLAPPLGQPLSADATTNYSGAWYGTLATFR